MQKLTCEMCGGTDLIKQDGIFVCQNCGTKYSVEEAKKMMIEGTVDVQGTVKVDNSAFIEKSLANARRAKEKEDWKETEKYYNLVEQNEPTNIEAIFYSSFAQVKLALIEAETAEKRKSVFNILKKSVSVIDDNFDNTSEEHLKLLFQIMEDLKGLRKGTIVPTTHLQDYETKNGYGNVVDRSQIVKNDSLDKTYAMINEAIEAYMDSLANIIIEYSNESIKKLFLENIGYLSFTSDVHKKVEGYIDGYKTPNMEDAVIEIANQIGKIREDTSIGLIELLMRQYTREKYPYYEENFSFELEVKSELRKRYPDIKALKLGGCYVATAVYGSYDCPQVWTLRRYRDYTLAESWYGRAFIHTYYTISPTLVKCFGDTTWFKNMWKPKLDKMIENLRAEGIEDTPYEDRNW